MEHNSKTGVWIALGACGVLALAIVVHLSLTLYFFQARFVVAEQPRTPPPAAPPEPDPVPAAAPADPSRNATAPSFVWAASPDGAFRRHGREQIYGRYRTTTKIITGACRFDEIYLGGQIEFAEATRSGDMVGWAPVMVIMTYAPLPAPGEKTAPEPRRINLLPTRYDVTGDIITFTVHDPQAGDVTFTGKLDLPLIDKYIKLEEASTEPVLHGDLTVNGTVYPGVDFTYYPGG